MVVPSFTRGLLAPAQARPTIGSGTGPVKTSESHSESKPSSSSPVSSSPSASGVEDAAAAPTPMRIFIARPSDSRRLQADDLVEPPEADEEGGVGDQLDDLGLREGRAQLAPERVIDLVVIDGELLGEPDRRPFPRAQQIGGLVVDRRDLR